MKYVRYLLATSLFLPAMMILPTSAQEPEVDRVDEIIVTGRNRQESLQDVPVSASVLTETFLDDAGIANLYDLFEMIPGLQYNELDDRLASQPSIRGVQSNEISTNRVKVSAFIDGMPVLGSQGSIGFNSFEQVEVYRGPQSAAFGRSTFAGAINYITKDPTDTFEAEFAIDANDFGRRVIEGSIGGPLTETLGVLVQFEHEDSGALSEYRASGNAAEDLVLGTNINQSDGTEFGTRSGDNISAKFVFEPSDTFRTALTFSHVKTGDAQNPSLWLSEEERDACFEGVGTTPVSGMQGIYLTGTMDCDWENNAPAYSNFDNEQYLQDNPLLLAYLVDAATNPLPILGSGGMNCDPFTGSMCMNPFIPAGPSAEEMTLANGDVLSVEEQILLVASAYSIPEGNRGTHSERDRITLQTEKIFDDGSAIEFSFMHNEETQSRLQDTNAFYYDPDDIVRAPMPGIFGAGDTGVNATLVEDGVPGTLPGLTIRWVGDPDGDLATDDGYWQRPSLNGSRYVMAAPVEIEEDYASVRWVSPGDERLRYLVGASYYNYNYLETNYGCNQGLPDCPYHAGVAYGALLSGITEEFTELTSIPFVADNGILSEEATNTAAYFNIGYDLTDRLTVSAEGRYQSDKIGGVNVDTGLTADVTTTSFLPRVAISYSADEDTTYYVQWSKGVNPAGINVDMLNSIYIDSIDAGIANGLIPYTAANDVDLVVNADGTPGSDGIVDDFDLNTFAYASYTGETWGEDQTGFDSETFQSYREEQLTNIEFGFKGNLLDGDLTYAGAIYMIDWKDQLQNGDIYWGSPCADDDLAGSSVAGDPLLSPCVVDGQEYFWISENENTSLNGLGLNYGDVKIKGLELEGTYRLSRNWQIRGAASYMQAEYDSYCDIALENSGVHTALDVPAILDIELLVPGPESTITSPCYVVDGNEVANQPELTGALSPSYSTDIAGMRFGARLDIRYEGEKWLESGNWAKYPSVTTTNLSFSLSGDAWAATFYVNNLTDNNTPRTVRTGGGPAWQIDQTTLLTDVAGNTVSARSGNLYFAPRVPRTLGLRANYRF